MPHNVHEKLRHVPASDVGNLLLEVRLGGDLVLLQLVLQRRLKRLLGKFQISDRHPRRETLGCPLRHGLRLHLALSLACPSDCDDASLEHEVVVPGQGVDVECVLEELIESCVVVGEIGEEGR